MNCPHCDAREHICVPTIVYLNTKRGGNRQLHFTCRKCKKVISALCQNIVKVSMETKSDKDSDFAAFQETQ